MCSLNVRRSGSLFLSGMHEGRGETCIRDPPGSKAHEGAKMPVLPKLTQYLVEKSRKNTKLWYLTKNGLAKRNEGTV